MQNRMVLTGADLESSNPEEIQEFLSPVLGIIKVTPLAPLFRAAACVRLLPKLSVFVIQTTDSTVDFNAPRKPICATIPFVGDFRAAQSSGWVCVGPEIHMARPGENLTSKMALKCQTLGVSLNAAALQENLYQPVQSDPTGVADTGKKIKINSAAGTTLAKSMMRLWSGLNSLGDESVTSARITQLEQQLIESLVIAVRTLADQRDRAEPFAVSRAMARAEKHLCSSLTSTISRADLADVAGVSIRTLSREFLKRHGVGPMSFFRARRLDAAYRQLFASDAGSTSVTDVAGAYGFNNLGRFAAQYKQAFGESPSVTLKR